MRKSPTDLPSTWMRALDLVGLWIVLLLIVGVSLHFSLPPWLSLYREVAAALFTALLCLRGSIRISRETIALLGYVALLSLLAITQAPGRLLYDELGVISEWQAEHLLLSQFRSAMLYVPMVIYLSTRGISLKERNRIAWTMTAAIPIALGAFILGRGELSLTDLSRTGGNELGYLDFLPLLAFYGLASCYLLQMKQKPLARLVAFTVLWLLATLLVLSSGRQNVVWMIVMFAINMLTTEGRTRRTTIMATLVAACVIGAAATTYVMTYGASAKFLDRFTSIDGFLDLSPTELESDSTRTALALTGLKMIKPTEWPLGIGLESCPGPGPHCDYIRQVMRGGLLLVIVGYMPCAMAIRRGWRAKRRERRSPLSPWMCGMAFFPIFFALFGFPREDACKAFASFLGLGLCIALDRSTSIQHQVIASFSPTLARRNVPSTCNV